MQSTVACCLQDHPEVTILFTDIVGFTNMSAQIGARSLLRSDDIVLELYTCVTTTGTLTCPTGPEGVMDMLHRL